MAAGRHGRPAEGQPHRTAARRQGRVFAVGVGAMAAVVLAAAGFTWASQGRGREAALAASPQASATAAAHAKVGECGMVVAGKAREVPLAEARTLTMIAAVGQQVRAPDEQTARAVEAALAKPGAKLPKVTDALGLLAREYDVPATPDRLAELRALSTPGGLTCAYADPKAKKEKTGSGGLTPRASALRSSVLDAFGQVKTTGAAGRAFDIPFAPVTDANRTHGWVLAHWLVASAGQYQVSSVSYDGWRWTTAAGAGWRPLPPALTAPTPAPTPATAAGAPSAPSAAEVARSVAARYLDRLHVTVATGR